MNLQQWKFMQTTMPEIKQLLLAGKNVQANKEISVLKERQREYAGDTPLPSDCKIEAERWYNRLVRPVAGGVLAVCIGLIALIFPMYKPGCTRFVAMTANLTAWLLTAFVASSMGVLWWVSGHVPLSNGPETMMFMALVALAGACCCRDLMLRGGLLVVAAISLFVATMGGRTPHIGAMMPVLASPLLSVHVAVIMISYTMFFLMAILAAMALAVKNSVRRARLTHLNHIILTPAVCLLGAGIFIGAVWANQTWGRYWGWDPKETCALVMWLIYALPLHSGIRHLAFFRRDRAFNIYILSAILSVLFTYFGANYLLPGLHSYA
ncbi:MAG: cytochrome c biogenesis protein CcsA, partial [Muribaculaceae bacterium]|nr:cytochrome c biogenesis protein CcsA [Muribaculaceae bacterium]